MRKALRRAVLDTSLELLAFIWHPGGNNASICVLFARVSPLDSWDSWMAGRLARLLARVRQSSSSLKRPVIPFNDMGC